MSGPEKAKSDVVEQFTAQVDRFFTSPHVNQPEPVARYVGTVTPPGDERVLDVGCGPGLLAKAFAPHVREYVGVDLTPVMVAKAADIARAAGIANARFEVGDPLALPFEAASFDLALSRLALHHMSDPRRAIQQMVYLSAFRVAQGLQNPSVPLRHFADSLASSGEKRVPEGS
jgi:SAM-dependent methyltransferase